MLHRPQPLISSSRGTTSSGPDRISSGTTWCFTACKPLFLRHGAPRPQGRIGFRAARRGASPPANPYSFVAEHHSIGPNGNTSGTTWCFTARKPLFHRRGAPCPQGRIGFRAARRGASLPANPYSFDTEHHVHDPEREYERWDVVLHHPQTLIPSSRGTMSSGTDRVSSGGTWCFTARKPLFHRRGAPRPRPRIGLRPVGRGASLPANPYSIVAGHHVLGPEREFRQHAGNEEPKLTAGPFEKDPAVLNVCQAWRKSYG